MKKQTVTDEEIKAAFTDNFSSCSITGKREVIAECILKIFAGYSDSAILIQIITGMGLISKKGTILKRGKEYLMNHYYRSK